MDTETCTFPCVQGVVANEDQYLQIWNEPTSLTVRSVVALYTRLHQELLPYSKLMHWLKQVEPKNYQQLQSTYTCSLQKLYQRDLDRFFEDAFVRVNGSGASVVASQVFVLLSAIMI